MQTAIERYQGSWRMPSFEDATVGDAMHPGVLVCSPDESFVDIARAFATHHVHAILVEGISGAVAGHGERLVWRVLSDNDFVAAAVGARNATAGDIARTEAATIERGASLLDAAHEMTDRHVSHLIVMDGGRPVGVISTLDIAGTIAWGRA